MARRAYLASLASALALAATPASARDGAETFPSPGEIVDAAPAGDWAAIAAEDLLVMDLVPDRGGNLRRVIIQLMPPPFSQGWIDNIRVLAKAHWWDGTSVYRVQDNYVVQWGDETGEKVFPDGLKEVPESEYVVDQIDIQLALFGEIRTPETEASWRYTLTHSSPVPPDEEPPADILATRTSKAKDGWHERDSYSLWVQYYEGWPLGNDGQEGADALFWPIHCYGMVGVGRDLSPNTGSGAELYTVIGHAPRHLDRNIALVGRIIEGMEHLSSLPRGHGALGFYDDDEAEKRVPILSVRLGSELEEDPMPSFEYLSTESDSFARYAEARANRRDPFFIVPAGGADICNLPVPVRRVPGE